MRFVLDCSSRDAALASLCTGFGCTAERLKEVLLSLNLEAIYESEPCILKPCEQYLYDFVCAELGEPRSLDGVYWFHGTRTAAGNMFEKGILTLDRAKGSVLSMLAEMAPDADVRSRLRSWGEDIPDEMYGLRTGDRLHWGPFGVLVRESHHGTQHRGQHDYLAFPELVEDVCNAYQDSYNVDLKPHYSKVLQPKIVWFESALRKDEGCIEAALGYAYTSVRNLPPDGMSVTCIDCNGTPVPAEAILRVE